LKKNLKDKLLKFNFFSIFAIIMLMALIYAPLTYKLSQEIVNISNNETKKFYIDTQKHIIKNQVNNFINYLKHLKEEKTKDIIQNFDILLEAPKSNIKLLKNPQKAFKKLSKALKIDIVYISDNKLIFPKNIKLPKIDFNKHIQKIKNNYYIIKKVSQKSYLIGIVPQKMIDKRVTEEAIKYLYSIRFGAKNNGYISIAKILNYKGGKKFARVVALPVKPQWVGKYLNENKKDAKGHMYRKEYLKIVNTTKEGYVSYWFFKKSDKTMHPKISYIKLYKPYNWLIFSSVYLDDINKVIDKRNKLFAEKIKEYSYFSLLLYSVILLIIFFIVKYENKIFKELINNYEEEIEKANRDLQELNKNLSRLVDEKTEEIIEKYFTDNLTKLPNRLKLLNDIDNNYIAILNINSFKEINDFYGIKTGDKVLIETSKILTSFSKNVYKLAADEYAIIANKPNILVNLTKKINKYLLNHPLQIDNEKFYITFKVGIGKNLQEADLALKYAKSQNKSVIVFNKNLPILKDFENNIKWKQIIYEAIETDNIIPFVQAIIDNKTQKIIKYECLVRLKHNNKIYTPYFFLDIARKTNQYEIIQKIMIEKCFKKFAKIKKEFSINLETEELENHQFQKWLLKHIKKYDVADFLTIELLENQNMLNNEEVKKFVKTLKEKNIKIAIDDFGSGYSNFIYLIKDLPTDILKIDGSIVKDIDKKEIYILLKKIIEIAKEFNFITIAEFVENNEIYKKLQEIGVDASQGYYFSKPFDINEL